MNHDLAKKLKDAGFMMFGRELSNQPPGFIGYFNEDGTAWYPPTLPDLIEACVEMCPNGFGLLYQGEGIMWEAIDNYENDLANESGQGPTPEEAVAMLYLKLHKK